ncbi:hypothetical protein [Ruminococcus flavefaciens]|uniref:hypothetical protein n=1 Tax=Ruminococcus flavefaciens TaxID=1265 RepID=UPI003F093A72
MSKTERVMVTIDGKKPLENVLPSKRDLISLLYDFVERVTKGKATSKTEIAVLPEVASRLFEMMD